LATFINDSYVGFDKEIPLEFEIVKDDPTRVIPEYSKEDIDALKKPGLFQLMLDQGAEEEDTDDEEEEEETKTAKSVEPVDDLTKLKRKLEKAGLGEAAVRRENQLAK
jgi:hypothetical protein